MKKILCLTDSLDNFRHFIKDAELHFFPIEQMEADQHSFSFFEQIFRELQTQMALDEIDLIVAEYIEAIPLVYFIRAQGYYCPALFIPHTNAYPLNILFYFLLVSQLSHPGDRILCGSMQAAKGFEWLVQMKALPVCTFGIQRKYQRGDKSRARKQLGLPRDARILLYTGRFMNDKGLASLIDVYQVLQQQLDHVLLVLSITHFDPHYYNSLAPRLKDAIVFYRLENDSMLLLYQSADLFVSLATSIFETYGKSPMEAISCGTPALLPNWDGFRYYINGANGALADVIYSEADSEVPYSFAKVDIEDFTAKATSWLMRKEPMEYTLPEWTYYDTTMETLTHLVTDILSTHQRFYRICDKHLSIVFSEYPDIIQCICQKYGLKTIADIEFKTEALGLINRDDPGDLTLLKSLHDQLFQMMDSTSEVETNKLTVPVSMN